MRDDLTEFVMYPSAAALEVAVAAIPPPPNGATFVMLSTQPGSNTFHDLWLGRNRPRWPDAP